MKYGLFIMYNTFFNKGSPLLGITIWSFLLLSIFNKDHKGKMVILSKQALKSKEDQFHPIVYFVLIFCTLKARVFNARVLISYINFLNEKMSSIILLSKG